MMRGTHRNKAMGLAAVYKFFRYLFHEGLTVVGGYKPQKEMPVVVYNETIAHV
jgi:hypothetical protein